MTAVADAVTGTCWRDVRFFRAQQPSPRLRCAIHTPQTIQDNRDQAFHRLDAFGMAKPFVRPAATDHRFFAN